MGGIAEAIETLKRAGAACLSQMTASQRDNPEVFSAHLMRLIGLHKIIFAIQTRRNVAEGLMLGLAALSAEEWTHLAPWAEASPLFSLVDAHRQEFSVNAEGVQSAERVGGTRKSFRLEHREVFDKLFIPYFLQNFIRPILAAASEAKTNDLLNICLDILDTEMMREFLSDFSGTLRAFIMERASSEMGSQSEDSLRVMIAALDVKQEQLQGTTARQPLPQLASTPTTAVGEDELVDTQLMYQKLVVGFDITERALTESMQKSKSAQRQMHRTAVRYRELVQALIQYAALPNEEFLALLEKRHKKYEESLLDPQLKNPQLSDFIYRVLERRLALNRPRAMIHALQAILRGQEELQDVAGYLLDSAQYGEDARVSWRDASSIVLAPQQQGFGSVSLMEEAEEKQSRREYEKNKESIKLLLRQLQKYEDALDTILKSEGHKRTQLKPFIRHIEQRLDYFNPENGRKLRQLQSIFEQAKKLPERQVFQAALSSLKTELYVYDVLSAARLALKSKETDEVELPDSNGWSLKGVKAAGAFEVQAVYDAVQAYCQGDRLLSEKKASRRDLEEAIHVLDRKKDELIDAHLYRSQKLFKWVSNFCKREWRASKRDWRDASPWGKALRVVRGMLVAAGIGCSVICLPTLFVALSLLFLTPRRCEQLKHRCVQNWKDLSTEGKVVFGLAIAAAIALIASLAATGGSLVVTVTGGITTGVKLIAAKTAAYSLASSLPTAVVAETAQVVAEIGIGATALAAVATTATAATGTYLALRHPKRVAKALSKGFKKLARYCCKKKATEPRVSVRTASVRDWQAPVRSATPEASPVRTSSSASSGNTRSTVRSTENTSNAMEAKSSSRVGRSHKKVSWKVNSDIDSPPVEGVFVAAGSLGRGGAENPLAVALAAAKASEHTLAVQGQ